MGRFVILQVLREAGEGLVRLEKITNENGTPSLVAHLDKTKIHTVGKEALRKFLTTL